MLAFAGGLEDLVLRVHESHAGFDEAAHHVGDVHEPVRRGGGPLGDELQRGRLATTLARDRVLVRALLPDHVLDGGWLPTELGVIIGPRHTGPKSLHHQSEAEVFGGRFLVMLPGSASSFLVEGVDALALLAFDLTYPSLGGGSGRTRSRGREIHQVSTR